MSISGINLFRDAMAGFEGCYVLIGGSACELLFAEQGETFRATKDLDIVVLADSSNHDFINAFWTFIQEGGYEPWCNSEGVARFYRFVRPKTPGYPHMIELFARHPEFTLENEGSEIAPLPFDEDISSLSAILLDDDYYALLLDGLHVISGISVLDEAHLIALKMRAHLDLNERAACGQHVNEADLKKHRKDVLRLLEYVPNDITLNLPERIKGDARAFIETINEPNFRIDQLGLSMDKEAIVERLKVLCGV